MNAYSEIREISENDLALVDDFVSIRHIWLLGHQIHLPVVKGWLSDKFFTDQLKLLKDQCGERGIEI